VIAVGRGKLFILLRRRPAANFLAILVDEPHGFRADLPRRAIDDNLSASWMLGAIKAPDPNVGETTEVVNIDFGRPKRKPFEDFGTGAPRGPDILDEAISQWRLHGFSSPFECHLIHKEQESRGE
jgi:hypothetical protein